MVKKNFLGGILVILFVFIMVGVGCDNGTTNNGSRNITNSNLDPALFGTWESYEMGLGLIFYPDGTLHFRELDGTISNWNWSTRGNILTISYRGESETFTYSINGRNLYLNDMVHYVKQ